MRSPGLPSLGFPRGRAPGGGHLHGGHATPEAMLRPAESGEGPPREIEGGYGGRIWADG